MSLIYSTTFGRMRPPACFLLFSFQIYHVGIWIVLASSGFASLQNRLPSCRFWIQLSGTTSHWGIEFFTVAEQARNLSFTLHVLLKVYSLLQTVLQWIVHSNLSAQKLCNEYLLWAELYSLKKHPPESPLMTPLNQFPRVGGRERNIGAATVAFLHWVYSVSGDLRVLIFNLHALTSSIQNLPPSLLSCSTLLTKSSPPHSSGCWPRLWLKI